MYLKKLPLISIILLGAFSISAQEFPVQKIAVEDGLGHSIVYRTYQTSDGYLWFSTDNGLTRYDGNSFTNYTSEDGLGSNFILEVAEWKNKLYVSSFGAGIMVLDSGVFKPAVKDTLDQPLYPINLVPYENELWITDRYKRTYRFKDNKFLEINTSTLKVISEKPLFIHQIEKALDGGLYLATSLGLFHFRYNTFTKIEIPGLGSHESIVRLAELDNKNLILATTDKLLEVNLHTNNITTWLDKEIFAPESCVMKDAEGNVWAASMKGNLYLCKRGAHGSKHVVKILAGTVINHLYQDREKNLWLSTYGEGAWWIQSIYVRNHSIKGCIVADMIVDPRKNNVIVTTTNAGLRFFHQDESRYLSNATDEHLNQVFKNRKLLITASSLPNGTLFFSSHNMLYQLKQKKIDSVKAPRAVSTLYPQPKKNKIWIGCRFALAYTDTLFKKMTHINGFDKVIIRAIVEDNEGNILLGTDLGVYIQEGENFKLLPTENELKLYVNSLYLHKETGKVWVGTNSGLGFIENNRIKLIDHAITQVRCNSITSDNLGNLWVGTVNGLLQNNNGRFVMITTKDGLAQANIVKLIFQPENGLLTLLTPNAISVIDVESFLKSTTFTLPNIIIEKVAAGNKVLSLSDMPARLSSSVKDLTISVSSPLIKNRDKVFFSYKLNDKPWSEFDGQKITLQSLPYGALDITIKVEEHFNTTSKTATLSFFVKRPFYVTWWFITVVAALILGGIYWIVYFSVKKKNVRLVEENKRLDVEHKALRNLLNPHFIYNAINSIHAFILQNDQRKTLGYLSKFSQLVRLNLELLSTDRVALDKELKNISLYLEFEKLRFADKLNYDIQIDPAIDHSEIQIPSFIIQPFLENAIWHGLLPRPEGGNLSIKIKRENQKLIITIEDDGIGINASLKKPKQDVVLIDSFTDDKASMGINIIKERIDLLNKFQKNYALTITDKGQLNGKANGTGTIVKITIPIEYS